MSALGAFPKGVILESPLACRAAATSTTTAAAATTTTVYACHQKYNTVDTSGFLTIVFTDVV
jgi:hypothetical protein